MEAYRKEVLLTVISVILLVITGNMGLFFVWFPEMKGTFLGFPIPYIVPVIMGWVGMLVVTYITSQLGNQVDDEIEAATSIAPDKTTFKA